MMRYNRIALIAPSYGAPDPDRIPAGLGYIAESLKQHGITYSIVDMNLGYSVEAAKEVLEQFSPGLIGISTMTYMYKRHYDLARTLKTAFTSVPIAMGGPHVSLMRGQVLEECVAINYGFVMDAERSFVALCQGHDPADIRGLIHRSNGIIVFNGEPELLLNLDTIPFPTYEGFELENYTNRAVDILTSRGCPFNCIFCGHHLVGGKKFRVRSVEHVVSEISYWIERGWRRFNVLDSNFSLQPQRVYDFCDEIKKHNLDIEIWCGTGLRADRVDRKLLERMREVGFSRISIGVEGGNDKILKNLKKGVKIETVERAISDACDLDFEVTLFFVVGSPGETWADIEDSAALALKYPIAKAFFHNLTPYPATELFEWVDNHGYFIQDPARYLNDTTHVSAFPTFATPELPEEERLKVMKYLARVEKEVLTRSIEKRVAKFGLIVQKMVSLLFHIYLTRTFQWLKNNIPLLRRLVRLLSDRLGL